MSVVRPEYGPTLPELVGPRLATVPRRTKIAVVALLALLVVAVAAVFLARRDPPTAVVVEEPVAFNLVYDEQALTRVVEPPEGAVFGLAERGDRAPQQLLVEPVTLPAYRGDPSAALLGLSSPAIEELRREVGPTFLLRSEGRFRVNEATSGYQIAWQSREEGEVTYGKRFLLVPDDYEEPPREALQVDLVVARNPANPNVDSVGVNGPLKRPLRSIRFGSERP